MLSYTDQLGTRFLFKEQPKRIVSLVPSQSELLWDLGLREELVGITKFCIHPEALFRNKERVGGTKQLDLDKIRQLRPDLIIGNKEENEQQQIEALQQEFPVWVSDIYDFKDTFQMIQSLGKIVNREPAAQELVTLLDRSLSSIHSLFAGQRVAYFIWNGPYMFAAKNTFIDHVLNHLGFENALSHMERYPILNVTALQELDPDICFLSSEPFPFKEKHVAAVRTLLPRAKVFIVDGELFSWYGSRLLHLEKYARALQSKGL